VTMAQLRARLASWHPDWPAEGIAGALANFAELPDGTVRARLTRDHHERIVRSMWEGDPARWYPLVDVPTLLVPAVGDPPSERDAAKAAVVEEARAALSRAEIAWYRGADHDLHAQQPKRLATDLLRLAATADAT
jgi:pimeloyl-ACP methyl ester carboxylesterase